MVRVLLLPLPPFEVHARGYDLVSVYADNGIQAHLAGLLELVASHAKQFQLVGEPLHLALLLLQLHSERLGALFQLGAAVLPHLQLTF